MSTSSLPPWRLCIPLNDPAILKQCIPGCEEIEERSNGEFAAIMRFEFGQLKARFRGKVRLFDRDPPNGYRLVGEGEGSVAGFAKSSAVVALADTPEGTRLTYQLEAKVGGKIAQLGQRLLMSTTKKMQEGGGLVDLAANEVLEAP